MIILSKAITLAGPSNPDWITANNPVIGWRNTLTPAMFSATSEDAEWPAINAGNPLTFLKWRSQIATEQFLNVDLGDDEPEPSNYCGIARHNFGTLQMPISLQGFVSGSWIDIVSPRIVSDDRPIMFRFPLTAYRSIRLRMYSGSGIPELAVMYLGKALVLQRRIYVGHTPINYGRKKKVINSRSESGNYLGEIITTESVGTALDLKNITPSFYRSDLDPFVANRRPFFFNWRPGDYPRETGYAWLVGDPAPTNAQGNGMMRLQLALNGIAE